MPMFAIATDIKLTILFVYIYVVLRFENSVYVECTDTHAAHTHTKSHTQSHTHT